MAKHDPDAVTVLIVPHGKARSRRIELSADVCRWLTSELQAALGDEPEAEQAPKVRRPVRLHRGQWRS